MQTIDLNNIDAIDAASNPAATISTTPSETPAGMFKLELRRRSTTANPIAEADRYRSALIPEGVRLLPSGMVPSKFAALVQDTIDALAQERFAEAIKANSMLREIDPRSYSVDALMSYWAEKKAAATIDGAAIAKWFEQSSTIAGLSEAARKVWRTELPKMAAPSYRGVFTKKQAAAIVSKIADSDLDSPAAQFVVNRCNLILSADESQAAEF